MQLYGTEGSNMIKGEPPNLLCVCYIVFNVHTIYQNLQLKYVYIGMTSNQSNSANLNSAMLTYERLFNYAVFRSVHSILFMETILQNHHHACMYLMWKYVQSF